MFLYKFKEIIKVFKHEKYTFVTIVCKTETM